jgi:hypothetical protein
VFIGRLGSPVVSPLSLFLASLSLSCFRTHRIKIGFSTCAMLLMINAEMFDWGHLSAGSNS